MRTKEFRAWINALPPHLDECEWVMGDGDPQSEAFIRIAPYEPERVKVTGVGYTLAVVVGVQIRGLSNVNRCIAVGSRSEARRRREALATHPLPRDPSSHWRD